MIRHLLLDLDNTLYPSSNEMDAAITRRMKEYVARFLGVSFAEGERLRDERYRNYGTTLEWLRIEHGLEDMEEYFNFVHPEEEIEELESDPGLRDYLLSLELPMTLLTNGPRCHAERLLSFFNIEDIFREVYDISRMEGQGKPHEIAYRTAMEGSGIPIGETLFVDDYLKYLRPFKTLGGRILLVDENGNNAGEARNEGIESIASIYELASWLAAHQGQ